MVQVRHVLEHVADAAQPAGRLPRMHRAARHALAGDRFQQAALTERNDARDADEDEEERHADDEDGEARRQRQAYHHDGEVHHAGGEREQHVKERAVGARVHEHTEEAPQRALRRGGPRRRIEGRLHLHLGVAIGGRHLLGCAVGAGDELEHVGLGLVGMRGHLGAQVLLGVVERVLDQRGILIGERGAQLPQVVIDRAGGIERSCDGSFDEAIDEAACLAPDVTPLAQHRAALIGDAVVAARRPRVGGDDAAGEQTSRGEARSTGYTVPSLNSASPSLARCRRLAISYP